MAEDIFVSPEKASEMTGICGRTLRRWIEAGRCPGRRGPTGRYSVPMTWIRQHLKGKDDAIAAAE